MGALGLILAVSLTQIFPVWPSAGNIYSWYKSGYFSEIDRQYRTISDAFVSILMSSKPEYAWLFLEDIEKTQKVQVKVYDTRGDLVRFPGDKVHGTDETVLRLVRSMNPSESGEVKGKVYSLALPLVPDKRYLVFHDLLPTRTLAGVLVMEREYDATIYYTSERRIIFSVISLICVVFLFIVYLWDPERRVKELFDK
jgi:hypothetical protein